MSEITDFPLSILLSVISNVVDDDASHALSRSSSWGDPNQLDQITSRMSKSGEACVAARRRTLSPAGAGDERTTELQARAGLESDQSIQETTIRFLGERAISRSTR